MGWARKNFIDKNQRERETAFKRIQETETSLDKIRGSLFGGAAGDALGYPVEFLSEEEIFSQFGENGIQQYELDRITGKALISDDTQMTLFTANGLLAGEVRGCMRRIQGLPRSYVSHSYQDWLRTQEISFEESRKILKGNRGRCISWLADVPELYSQRAPGNTCLSALEEQKDSGRAIDDYIKVPQNDSKGCGGIMRIAPLALQYHCRNIKELDYEGAELAAITHGHSLGYMPAAVLTHIISRIVFPEKPQTLKEIVLEARDTAAEIFAGDKHLKEMTDLIDLAIRLSENGENDLDSIREIGEGWVAEETLGISIYCALRYQNDFSAGIIAAVNHGGDSDSTGAVTGNILGALLGYDAIEEKWKTNLELADVILEVADDLCHGWQMSEHNYYEDPDWVRKYMEMRRRD
ncbi:ADP-ribosylglycohydrolase family protein [Lachnospiraceae bacterium 62-35]